MKNCICIDGKQIELSEETARNMKVFLNDDTIYVPDIVVFEEHEGNLGLRFGNDRVLVWADESWNVGGCDDEDIVKTKLTPCKREDLEAGDWAYGCNHDEDNFTAKSFYCLIIDDKKFRWICDDADVDELKLEYKYWRKVEVVS